MHIVQEEGHTQEKLQALYDLSDYWLYIDSAKSMDFALQAYQIGKQLNDKFVTAVAHYYIAGVYMEHADLETAKMQFNKALTLLKDNKTIAGKRYQARIWHNLGAIEQRQDNDAGFLALLIEKACPILESIGDSVLLANNYYDIGNVFFGINQYDKALQYFKNAIQLLTNQQEYADAVECRLGIVKTLIYQEHYTDSVRINMKAYLDEAYQLLKGHPQAFSWLSYFTVNGLYFQYVTKQTDEALHMYDQGLAFLKDRQEPYRDVDLMNRKYYLYADRGDWVNAQKMAEYVYHETGKQGLSHDKLVALRNLVDVEEALHHRDRAFRLLKQYVALSDTVRNQQLDVKLNLIEKKYEAEKKEKQILQLKTDNQLKTASLKYNTAMLTFTGSGLVCLSALLILAFLLYKNKTRLVEKQQQLHQEQVRLLKKEQQINFFNAMLQGQEQERKRLASDLHDGLGGLLSNIKLLLSKDCPVEKTEEGKTRHELILSRLDKAVDELRRIARNLMPETLLHFGLVTALRDFCEDLERSGVHIALQTYGFTLDDNRDRQMMVYRILQELINNAVKHAEAKNILVQCIQNDDRVFITVEDDGCGFDSGKEVKGIGLHNVKNRVAYLNGHLDIQSQPGVGTTINVEFNTHEEYLPTYS